MVKGNNPVDALKRTARDRSEMLDSFGFIPKSIITLSRGALSRSMFCYQKEHPDVWGNPGAVLPSDAEVLAASDAGYNDKLKRTQKRAEWSKALGRNVAVAPYGGSSKDRKIVSIMAAELVDFFIKYYAEPGDTYIDPFAGHGIRLQVANLHGLHYYGYDVCEEYCRYIQAVKQRLPNIRTVLEIYHKDSRHPDELPDAVGDFSFTSPPYWNLEFYDANPDQLGTGQTYEDFIRGLGKVASAWLPKFKDGAYNVVNVNDFRSDGKFYPYHADVISTYCSAGWNLHDIFIIDGLVGGMTKVFAVSHNKKKIVPRLHEYALVFRKA